MSKECADLIYQIKQIRSEIYVKAIRECENERFAEDTHEKADALLCDLLKELGYNEVVAEYEKLNRMFG